MKMHNALSTSQPAASAEQGVDGVVPIRDGLNPATWMLEISTPGAESAIGIDFAEHFINSDLAK